MTRQTMLRNLQAGVRVECNVRGRVFWATLLRWWPEERMWQITPPKGVGYHRVTLRQIRNAEKMRSPDDSQVRKSG